MRSTGLLILILTLSACSDSSGRGNNQDAGPMDGSAGDASILRELTWQPEMRLTSDVASSYTTYNFARNIAVDDAGRVHIVFYDNRQGADHVYYLRSVDSGSTWVPLQQLTAAVPGGEHPSLAVSGEDVYVVWHDEFDDLVGPKPRVLIRQSMDGGNTWEPEFVLADRPEGQAHPCVAATGDNVHVTWVDNHTGYAEVSLRSSPDRGATWGTELRISEEPFESWVPTVEANGDLVLVAWVDYRDANEEEYMSRSTDGGLSFSPPVRLTDDPHDSWAPSVAILEDHVHLFWFDRRDCGLTDSDVEAEIDEVLVLMGLTPDPAPPRDPAQYYLHLFLARLEAKHAEVQAEAPNFQANGGDMALLQQMLTEYYTSMQQWTVGWEIYYKRSSDQGQTFGPDTRLTHTNERSHRPSAAVFGDEVHVVWFDGRHNSDLEIYHQRSVDQGVTWGQETRITDAPGTSMHAHLAVTTSGVHLVWYDERSGKPEIYYRRALFGP